MSKTDKMTTNIIAQQADDICAQLLTSLNPQTFPPEEHPLKDLKQEFEDTRPLTHSQEMVLSALDPTITDAKNKVLVRIR
jgi:hypothetical protein